MSKDSNREVEDIHKWEFLKEDKYHETWRSEYCGEIQVQKALADHIRHHQLQKARYDWLQEEIVKLEGQMRIEDYPHYDKVTRRHCLMDDKKFNHALQTIIDRYQSELDQDKK